MIRNMLVKLYVMYNELLKREVNMRTENAIKNISISIFSQVVIILLGFLSRKVFIDSLGTAYLGVNGLLTNVLSMMVLIEGGIGISITYNLYKPLAENDQPKIISLVQLYKKVYGILALIIFILSIIIYPMIGRFAKGVDSISNLTLVYFIFVAKNMVSYITAYKWALINADQKGYVLSTANLVFQVITTIAKIIILYMTSNYIIYLLVELGIYLVQVLFNGSIVNKRYPYIKTKQKYSLDNDVKDNIVTNVKAMFLHNIGGYCVAGTDNILLSYINITIVGLYSNYTMITGQLTALISPILGGISAGVGNLIATENNTKTYSVFQVAYLVNFWIYSLCIIFLYNLLEPFITWWLKDGLLLGKGTFLVILLNLYISGMRSTVITFKSNAGLFVQDKYAPVIEGILNLMISIILMKRFGMIGVFIGTTISTLIVPFWNQPRILFKYGFEVSVWEYFRKYLYYVVLTVLVGVLTTSICNLVVVSNLFLSLVIKGLICVGVINLCYIVIFFRTEEFKYLLNIIKPMAAKMKNKLAIN